MILASQGLWVMRLRSYRKRQQNWRASGQHDRVRILDEVEGQLAYQPQVGTRNRKMLDVEVAGFDFNPPL